MSEENRIRFAGLMEDYLNIPSFVCEIIEKQLQDNKYKEVIEYIVQRRNEIENKEDYLSEQEKINRYLDLQQKVEQLEKENKELNRMCELYSQSLYNADLTKAEKKVEQLENIRKEAIKFLENEENIMDTYYKHDFRKYPDYDPFNAKDEEEVRCVELYGYDDLLNILNKGSDKQI